MMRTQTVFLLLSAIVVADTTTEFSTFAIHENYVDAEFSENIKRQPGIIAEHGAENWKDKIAAIDELLEPIVDVLYREVLRPFSPKETVEDRPDGLERLGVFFVGELKMLIVAKIEDEDWKLAILENHQRKFKSVFGGRTDLEQKIFHYIKKEIAKIIPKLTSLEVRKNVKIYGLQFGTRLRIELACPFTVNQVTGVATTRWRANVVLIELQPVRPPDVVLAAGTRPTDPFLPRVDWRPLTVLDRVNTMTINGRGAKYPIIMHLTKRVVQQQFRPPRRKVETIAAQRLQQVRGVTELDQIVQQRGLRLKHNTTDIAEHYLRPSCLAEALFIHNPLQGNQISYDHCVLLPLPVNALLPEEKGTILLGKYPLGTEAVHYMIQARMVNGKRVLKKTFVYRLCDESGWRSPLIVPTHEVEDLKEECVLGGGDSVEVELDRPPSSPIFFVNI